jgi:hypothetical protein
LRGCVHPAPAARSGEGRRAEGRIEKDLKFSCYIDAADPELSRKRQFELI